MFSVADRRFMARAVQLAELGRYWARPNPHVGCVLVRGEELLGEGFTQPAGGDHAEIVALKMAGGGATAATAYVTLEPCSHVGRTPPCARALIEAGVARVVIAVSDPNPKVAGSGIQALREAGVRVELGLLAEQVEQQLVGFLARHRRGRGHLRIKMAMSLDGRTAMASGESRWITGPAARRDVQRFRAASCAIVTGIGTVLADNCALSVRDENFTHECLPEPQRRALRVVADSQLRLAPGAAVLQGEQPTLVLHGRTVGVPEPLKHVDCEGIEAEEGALIPAAILECLAKRECNEILLESGPALAGSMLQSGLVDELLVYVAPRLLGSNARPLFDLPLERMADAMQLELVEQRQVGEDRRLIFVPQSSG